MELPNGDIIDDTALFSFEGVLLKENARPTLSPVFVANFFALANVPLLTSLVSISKSRGSKKAMNCS